MKATIQRLAAEIIDDAIDAEHLAGDTEHLRMAVRLLKLARHAMRLARHAMRLARNRDDETTTNERLHDTIPSFAKELKTWEK